jgi:catalase
LHFISEAFKHCKPIATSGHGIALLDRAFITGVKYADKMAGQVVSDKGVVTAGTEAEASEIADKFLDAIKKHRHWDREEKDMIPA